MTAPACFDILAFEFGQFGFLFFLFQFVETHLEDLHGALAVLFLTAFILTLHDDAGRQVGDANGGIVLLHVLAACAPGPVGINAQIRFVDLDVDIVLNVRP